MILEFKQDLIPNYLAEELGIKEYLEIFNLDQKILPYKVLNPLKEKEVVHTYKEITNILKKEDNLNKIINLSKKLNNLDWVIDSFENKNITQSTLMALGNFIKTDIELSKIESYAPLKSTDCKKILSIIQNEISLEDGSYRKSKSFTSKIEEINEVEEQLSKLASDYEQNIFNQTKVKMIYPWPKEIVYHKETYDRLKSCPLIQTKKKGDQIFIDYHLPKIIENVSKHKKKLVSELSEEYQKILNGLIKEIALFQKSFFKHYEERITRTYLYLLANATKKHNLTIPKITKEVSFKLKKGILPSLKEKRGNKYIPLTINLNKGSNILFGANMAGKTSSLKTVHFLSILVTLGLPVPALSLSMHFPSSVNIHLKSSGTIKNNLSSFGEELNFFKEDFRLGSIINVDELFQTTNPIAGKELSDVFIKHYKNKNLIFFCTTQYPDVLKIKGANLYKMKDINIKDLSGIKSIKGLLDKMPYQVECIKLENIKELGKESKKALHLAKNFINNDTLKKSIIKKIKEK